MEKGNWNQSVQSSYQFMQMPDRWEVKWLKGKVHFLSPSLPLLSFLYCIEAIKSFHIFTQRWKQGKFTVHLTNFNQPGSVVGETRWFVTFCISSLTNGFFFFLSFFCWFFAQWKFNISFTNHSTPWWGVEMMKLTVTKIRKPLEPW